MSDDQAKVRVEEMHVTKRGVDAVFSANKEVLGALVGIFVDLFKESGATNFVELECNSDLGPLAITIKRKLGKTPEQVATEALKRVTELEAELAKR